MSSGLMREIRAAGQLAAAESPTFKPLEQADDTGLIVRVPAPGSSPPSAANGTYRIVRTAK